MTFPETERVRYSKSPLAAVVCHFHFPAIARIVEEPPTSFQECVHKPFTNYAEQFGAGMPVFSPKIREAMMKVIEEHSGLRRATTSHEFTSLDDVWRISLTQTSLTITCQEYPMWEDFKQHVNIAFQALLSVYAPNHFVRLGLRYQDVVHRSFLDIADVPWSELLQPYITGELSSSVAESRVEKKLSEVLIQLDEHNARVSVHHGLAESEESSESGYIIDSDFYTEQQTEISDANTILDAFNKEARRFFRWCITDRLHEAMQPQRVGQD